MNRGILTVALSTLVLATASHATVYAVGGPIIQHFDAVVEEGRRVRFEWTVHPDRPDEQLSCVLDVDVDDPAGVDLGITDCGEDTSVDHTYDAPGSYDAALQVTSSAGGSERVLVTADVE